MDKKIYGFVGLGLIGGSIARSIKEFSPDSEIIAYTPHRETVDAAFKEGVVDTPVYELSEEFNRCDYIFLCAPVELNNDNLRAISGFINPKTTITDIGSVKSPIHNVVKELGLDSQFIGGHPMAGAEKIGFSSSRPDLLNNAFYILTKTDSTDENRLSDYRKLVSEMGAVPLIVPFDEHDYITAAISHVPHVISACLVNLVKEKDTDDELMKMIAAGGFKDITRISSSSPQMWTQICMTNSNNISDLLGNYIDRLSYIRSAIQKGDTAEIENFFLSARSYRESMK